MLVLKCALTEGSSIPVKVVVLTKPGEGQLIEMDFFIEKVWTGRRGSLRLRI